MGFPSTDGTSNLSGSGEFSAQPFQQEFAGLSPTPDSVKCPKCGMDVPRIARSCPNDGTDLLLRLGQVFAEKYELLDIVGSGAMGVIYKARHLILDKIVAIKVLHTNTPDANLIMRFQREAKAASSLSHINVITVYDFGVQNGTAPYMVMDYLHGKTLAEYMEERGQLPLRETLELIEQVLSALAHAQKKNILHRDLKPGNIMILEEDGEPPVVKILDFGLAKLLDREDQVSLSAIGSALGSPAYMSPEQATGLKVDSRSDLYSLGCVMYELLTGQPPLLGDSPMETLMNRLNKRVPPVREVLVSSKRTRAYNPLREIPTIVELFLSKLLERDQRDRFQSAQEARNYLNKIWEYVDVPESANDAISSAQTRTRKMTSSGRVTVREMAITDAPRYGNAVASPGADAQQPSAKRSTSELRKIVSGRQDKEKPIAAPSTDGQMRRRRSLEDWLQLIEQLSNRLIDLTQQFKRANPELYRVAIGLAIMVLIVIVLIFVR